MPHINLTDIIPAKWRKPVYAAWAIVAALIGATQIGYAAAEAGQPTWLTVAIAVWLWIGVATNSVARANVTDTQE